jgi:hypothetical protein
MKNFLGIAVVAIIALSNFAFADHTLKDAMSMNKNIANVVKSIEKAAGISCAVEDSEQSYTPGYPTSSAFTQVAQCWDAKRPRFVGELEISYTWIITTNNTRPVKLIGIKLNVQ